MVRGMRHFKKDRPQKEARRSPMSILEDKIDKLSKQVAQLSKQVAQLTKLVKLGVQIDKAALTQGGVIMAELDDLQAAVAAEDAGVDSAIALLNGLAAKLDAAIASGNPAALVALSTAIKTKTQTLADAVVADARP
jgi:chromosome segregation ATPase